MLRQLLDEGLPKEAATYLTLVSDCLREIEKVSIRAKMQSPLRNINPIAWTIDKFLKVLYLFFKVVRKLQIEEEKWIKAENEMIEELTIQKEKMYKIPKGEKHLTPLVFEPLRETLLKLQQMMKQQNEFSIC